MNVGYYHVVFTIPDLLNPVAYQNQRVVYDILFRAAAETLSELSADKEYLGVQIGFTAILHTWGQNMMHHPHVHCIVPGGGLSSNDQWVVLARNETSRMDVFYITSYQMLMGGISLLLVGRYRRRVFAVSFQHIFNFPLSLSCLHISDWIHFVEYLNEIQ